MLPMLMSIGKGHTDLQVRALVRRRRGSRYQQLLTEYAHGVGFAAEGLKIASWKKLRLRDPKPFEQSCGSERRASSPSSTKNSLLRMATTLH